MSALTEQLQYVAGGISVLQALERGVGGSPRQLLESLEAQRTRLLDAISDAAAHDTPPISITIPAMALGDVIPLQPIWPADAERRKAWPEIRGWQADKDANLINISLQHTDPDGTMHWHVIRTDPRPPDGPPAYEHWTSQPGAVQLTRIAPPADG